MTTGIKYWVAPEEKLHISKVQGPQQGTILFDHYSQAKVYKAGCESLNPDKKYAILRSIPERYEQVSLLTGEVDIHDY